MHSAQSQLTWPPITRCNRPPDAITLRATTDTVASCCFRTRCAITAYDLVAGKDPAPMWSRAPTSPVVAFTGYVRTHAKSGRAKPSKQSLQHWTSLSTTSHHLHHPRQKVAVVALLTLTPIAPCPPTLADASASLCTKMQSIKKTSSRSLLSNRSLDLQTFCYTPCISGHLSSRFQRPALVTPCSSTFRHERRETEFPVRAQQTSLLVAMFQRLA